MENKVMSKKRVYFPVSVKRLAEDNRIGENKMHEIVDYFYDGLTVDQVLEKYPGWGNVRFLEDVKSIMDREWGRNNK
jgi:hypothetical protein